MIEFIILGLIAGGLAGWFFASSRHAKQTLEIQNNYSKQLVELEGKAKSAEVLQQEFRKQIDQKESDIGKIRNELSMEQQEKVKALTELKESVKNLEEQKLLIETMKKEMTDTFNALSSAALKSSSEDFIRLAKEHLGNVVTDTKGKLGEHQAAMDGLVRPLQEALKKYEEYLHSLEVKRKQDYTSLDEQIKMLSTTHQQLQKETSSLVTALRKPQVSGSWGQLTLKRTAELAGMTAYCDFYEEVSVGTESGRLRPDMIVRLPNGREIVVDAKAPVDAYLKAIAEASEEGRQKALTHYVTQVRTHMNALGSKAYWDQFPKSPEMVVMFLPGESFFSAAIEHDHRLIEDSSLKRVIPATPTTLISLLKAVAYGWQQEQVTKSAQQISQLGKELYDRVSTLAKYFDDMGSAIEKTITAYNKIIGSMESRILPSIRKFKELGVAGANEISVLEQIETSPRNLNFVGSDNDNEAAEEKT
jgi:DNA recombination protein RmuC